MEYLLSILLGYSFGSIPSAYLIVKNSHNTNILNSGSGNPGALNSFEVTNSKLIGFLVLLADFVKGLIPIFIVKHLVDDNLLLLLNTSLFSVIGHCFSVFLKFKGGRGLATAAGSLITIAPAVFVIWVVLWLIIYIYKRNIHFANISASFLTSILSFSSIKTISAFTYPSIFTLGNSIYFSIYITSIMFIILIKHHETIKLYFNKSAKNEVNDVQN